MLEWKLIPPGSLGMLYSPKFSLFQTRPAFFCSYSVTTLLTTGPLYMPVPLPGGVSILKPLLPWNSASLSIPYGRLPRIISVICTQSIIYSVFKTLTRISTLHFFVWLFKYCLFLLLNYTPWGQKLWLFSPPHYLYCLVQHLLCSSCSASIWIVISPPPFFLSSFIFLLFIQTPSSFFTFVLFLYSSFFSFCHFTFWRLLLLSSRFCMQMNIS